MVVHLAVMLVAGVLIRGTQPPGVPEEIGRPASIVLTRVRSSSRTDYLSEATDERNSQQLLTGKNADSSTPNSSPAADPLASDSPPSGSSVKLPDHSGVLSQAPAEGLVITPGRGTGKGLARIGLSIADQAAILAEDAGLSRESRPSGPTTKVSLFGSAEAEGRSFVFLIDRSQSMGGEGLGAIAEAAKELASAVSRLSDQHTFQVIAYNQKPFYLTDKELIPASDTNKQQLLEFVKNLPALGATEHEMGIWAALKLKPDVIFIFTDGGDPYLNAGQLRAIREAARGRTAIHAIHFGSGSLAEPEHFLKSLAGQNGGSYVHIDMADR